KRSTDAVIRQVLVGPMERSFCSYRPYYGNYVMKWPSPTSWFGVHQDSCFVDESTAVSASIWVATTEVDEHNGAVWFFPGSHRMRSTVRGSNQATYSFQDVGAAIEARCGRIVRLAPGDAVVFDHRVVHWSYANTSDAPRLAAVLGVVPERATLLHHHASDDGATVETFAIDDEFFIVNDPFGSLLDGLRGYPSLGRRDLVVEPVTDDELARWLLEHPVEADAELAAELRAVAARAARTATPSMATENRGQGAAGPSLAAHAAAEADADVERPIDADPESADPQADAGAAAGVPAIEAIGPVGEVGPVSPSSFTARARRRVARATSRIRSGVHSFGRRA
ncbi:MAG TPA: phytanoyl-CoA dioxygenase family protein, partial [Microthrixaceae bacterium]|nr:phytanoyl-CoA dioxygenase family protein [Microthrixaceae bacterium]